MTEHGLHTKVDQQLAEVALVQYAFKNDKLQRVSVAIAQTFDRSHTGILWADEVELPELTDEDKNLIGTAWKTLARWRIITRLGERRRSKRDGRRGGEVAKYMLVSRPILEAFLRANKGTMAPKQYTQPALI